jgi:hypothetical protein
MQPRSGGVDPQSFAVSSSGERLTEKVVAFYHELFLKQTDPKSFPFDFLLLKVHHAALVAVIDQIDYSQLERHSGPFRYVFAHCLDNICDGPKVKLEHALQTFGVVVLALCKKKFNDFSSEIIRIICGIEQAETFFKVLRGVIL